MRTVFWDTDRPVMRMIDQRLLPFETVVPEYETYQAVADAIRDHYKPQGPSDSIPNSNVGQAVA